MNKGKSAKSEKRTEVLIIILFTIVALIIGGVIIVKNFSPSKPNLDSNIPFHTGDVETDTDEDGNKITPDVTDKFVRKEGIYNFLMVGYDKLAGLTDVNMIAQFDTNTGAINIVQMPRDTYARYNPDGYYRKINGALSYFERDLGDFANFIEKNLCIKIDFYGSVDLVAFRNIVDIIDGVDLEVPNDMDYDDPEQNLHIHLKKGYQHLDGDKAEQFVRFRKGYVTADIGRTDAQKIFITAFMKKFKESISVSTLTQIGTQMLKYAETNLSLNDFVFFATKVLSIDMNKLSMMTLPGKSVREYDTHGAWYYVLSRSSMLNAVNKYLNVYDKDISDKIFDPNCMFTNPDVDYMKQIYLTDFDSDLYVGGDVDENGIYIPRTKPSTSTSVTQATETTASPDETAAPETEQNEQQDLPVTESPETSGIKTDTLSPDDGVDENDYYNEDEN